MSDNLYYRAAIRIIKRASEVDPPPIPGAVPLTPDELSKLGNQPKIDQPKIDPTKPVEPIGEPGLWSNIKDRAVGAWKGGTTGAAVGKEMLQAGVNSIDETKLLDETLKLKKPSLNEIAGSQVGDKLKTINAGTDAYKDAKETSGTGWNDFWDWAKSDWKHILIPAGAVAMLFGSDWVKAAGAAALAWGGLNLYDRMKSLKTNPKIHQAILKYSVNNFQDIEEQLKVEDPEVAMGVRDYLAMVRYGGRDYIGNHMGEHFQNKFKDAIGTDGKPMGDRFKYTPRVKQPINPMAQ
jgi:hypothetical protein